MDVDEPTANGNAKRKARISTGKAVNYNVDGSESSDDAVPLVCGPTVFQFASRPRSRATAASSVYSILTHSPGQASKSVKEKARGLRFR
jgi:hypothetical protein